MSKNLIYGTIAFLALGFIGSVLYSRLQPSLENKEAVFRVVDSDESSEFPHVNKSRLEALAKSNYSGPSFAMTPEEVKVLVAESNSNEEQGSRLPANESSPTKPSSKAKK